MALRRSGQYQTAYGTTALTLKANEDESIRVTGLYSNGASTAHAVVTIGQSTVADYRVAGALGNHLAWPTGFSTEGPAPPGNLLDYCIENGYHRGFPIATGQTMTVNYVNAAGSVHAIRYDIYDAGDVKRAEPNGSDALERDYIVYGNTGATIATAVTQAYDTLVNPTEFDAFPFGSDVPGNTEMTLFGVCGSPFAPSENDGTNDISTAYMKFVRNQTVLFDKDLVGLAFWQALGTQSADQIGAGTSPIGNYSSTDKREPLIFTQPLTFRAGEELTVSVVTQIAGSGANYLIADQELAFIARSKRS